MPLRYNVASSQHGPVAAHFARADAHHSVASPLHVQMVAALEERAGQHRGRQISILDGRTNDVESVVARSSPRRLKDRDRPLAKAYHRSIFAHL